MLDKFKYSLPEDYWRKGNIIPETCRNNIEEIVSELQKASVHLSNTGKEMYDMILEFNI